ncbi:MAG TPA: hypothetical protein VF703_18625 [Pyrinomonadaceae bacterium]|jgi:hypothetical protein
MRKLFVTRRLPLSAAVAFVALCFCLPAAAQKGGGARTQPAPAKKLSVGGNAPGAGRVVGANYVNDFFGFQLTIPTGWRIADEDAARKIDQQGADLVAGDSAERRARLRAAASKNINLITMGTIIMAGGAGESALLIVGAEAIPAWLIKTPQEYMGQARRLLESSAMPVQVAAGTRSETIGGMEFAVIDVSSEQASGTIRQHYYATLKKGYALFFISTYGGDLSEKAIEDVLKSVKFK